MEGGVAMSLLTRSLQLIRLLRDEKKTVMDTTPVSVLLKMVEEELGKRPVDDFRAGYVTGLLDAAVSMFQAPVRDKLVILRKKGYTDTADKKVRKVSKGGTI